MSRTVTELMERIMELEEELRQLRADTAPMENGFAMLSAGNKPLYYSPFSNGQSPTTVISTPSQKNTASTTGTKVRCTKRCGQK